MSDFPRDFKPGLSALNPATYASGRYSKQAMISNAFNGYTVNELRVSPFFGGGPIDQVFIQTSGASGATGRFQILAFADNGDFYPGTFIQDFGEVDTSAVPGTLAITLADIVYLPKPCWLGGVQRNDNLGLLIASGGNPSGYSAVYENPLQLTNSAVGYRNPSYTLGDDFSTTPLLAGGIPFVGVRYA